MRKTWEEERNREGGRKAARKAWEGGSREGGKKKVRDAGREGGMEVGEGKVKREEGASERSGIQRERERKMQW